MTLALINKNTGTLITTVSEGSQFKLPNNDTVSPAYNGWSNSTYELKTVVEQSVPEGKRIVSSTVVYANSVPTNTHVLTDITYTSDQVNAERNRRITSGFPFGDKVYDFDSNSKSNISGAAQMAFMAIVAGAQPGDYYWHGGAQPFMWIAQDNSLNQVDAFTMVDLGKAAAAWEQAHIFAARYLKDQTPIPANYADNVYWP